MEKKWSSDRKSVSLPQEAVRRWLSACSDELGLGVDEQAEYHCPVTAATIATTMTFFIYCMLFYSLYVQLLSFSFTVICDVYFVYLFSLYCALC